MDSKHLIAAVGHLVAVGHIESKKVTFLEMAKAVWETVIGEKKEELYSLRITPEGRVLGITLDDGAFTGHVFYRGKQVGSFPLTKEDVVDGKIEEEAFLGARGAIYPLDKESL